MFHTVSHLVGSETVYSTDGNELVEYVINCRDPLRPFIKIINTSMLADFWLWVLVTDPDSGALIINSKTCYHKVPNVSHLLQWASLVVNLRFMV